MRVVQVNKLQIQQRQIFLRVVIVWREPREGMAAPGTDASFLSAGFATCRVSTFGCFPPFVLNAIPGSRAWEAALEAGGLMARGRLAAARGACDRLPARMADVIEGALTIDPERRIQDVLTLRSRWLEGAVCCLLDRRYGVAASKMPCRVSLSLASSASMSNPGVVR